MIRTRFIRWFVAVALLGVPAVATSGTFWRLSMVEMSQHADLIFVGTVEQATSRWDTAHLAILTDVEFRDLDLLHASANARQRSNAALTLTHAGGQVGDAYLRVSGQPEFLPGERYLVLAHDDGVLRASPILGGEQGCFRVATDPATGKEALETLDGRIVTGVDARGYVQTSAPAPNPGGSRDRIGGARESDRFLEHAPLANGPGQSFHPATEADQNSPRTLALSEGVTLIRAALAAPRAASVLESERTGFAVRRNDAGAVIEEPLPLTKPAETAFRIPSGLESVPLAAVGTGGGERSTLSPRESGPTLDGDPLGWCGYQNVPIVMEQVPTSWSWFAPINDCMGTYSLYADVFRFTYSDGNVGQNGQDEICGWFDDATTRRLYGYGWSSSAVAMTMRWSGCECCRLTETDVMFNPVWDWTDDPSVVWGRPNTVLFKPSLMHELGHTLGFMGGGPYDEDHYDYDDPTVMHAAVSDHVWEDGWGLHRADAYMLRRIYASRTTVHTIRDVGVESYYASNGLNNSKISGSTFNWGDPITLSKVTVENTSNLDLTDVRLRFFLSKNRTVDLADYQLGGYWSWSTFAAERYSVGDYSTSIPSGVPGGTYYVLAIVNQNGLNSDDFFLNNITVFSSKITVQNPPPVVTSVDPAVGERGRAIVFTVQGGKFARGATSAHFSSGVSVSGTAVENVSRLTVYGSVATGARLGSYDLTVSNAAPGGGSAVLRNALVIGIPIWAGDANNDGVVDVRDLLPVGRFWGSSGPARPGGSSWGRQMLTGDWATADAAYADCDGNGVVNADDVRPLVQNWRRTRSGPETAVDRLLACREILDGLPADVDGPTATMRRTVIAMMSGDGEASSAVALQLYSNAPNPFRHTTAITFEGRLPGAVVHVRIVDALGRLIWKQTVGSAAGGRQVVEWNGSDLQGKSVQAGIYFCQIASGSNTASRRMLKVD